jgi:hypothetical protein
MKAREVTAITNLTVAAEAFLAAGFLLGRMPGGISSRGLWALAMLFLAVGFLLGGIDHGFFEPQGNTRVRFVIRKACWFCAGIATWLITLSTACQFASGAFRTALFVVASIQLVIFLILATRIHYFLLVMLDYVPALLLVLVLNITGLFSGSGSWYMTVGIALSVFASILEGLRVDVFAPVDRNGLYHLVMMVAVVFLFLAVLGLKG